MKTSIRTISALAGYVIAFIAGAACVWFYPIVSQQPGSSWFPLQSPENRPSVFDISDFRSAPDISLPEIRTLGGTAKLVDAIDSQDFQLGYKVMMSVASVDLLKLPERFKHAGADGRLLVTQVHYTVTFDFDLIDGDGFKLLHVTSKDHTMESGKTNEFQGLSTETVPRSIAARTRGAFVSIVIAKCITCARE